MNLWQKAVAAFAAKAGVPVVITGYSEANGVRYRTDSYAGETVSDQRVLGLSAVWACVNLVCGTIASTPLMVHRKDAKGDKTVVADHPLYRVLHDSPNADQTAVDFWEYQAAAIELWGDSFALIERRGGSPNGELTALIPLPPAAMSVRRRDDGVLVYRWHESGRSYERTDADIFHVRGFGGSPLGGMSTLTFGRQAFGLAAAIDRAASTTFANGLRPSGTLTVEKFLTEAQREALETGLQEKFAGAMNAGRPMLLEGGTKWEALTINPEDAQMLESRGFSIEEICRFFGVPPFMIGHTEKNTSWGTGLEQQTLGFIKFTLRRRLKRIEQAAEKQLLTARDKALGLSIEFNLEGLLRGDSAGRSAFYSSGLANGWMTINEVRRRENLPPVAGGDVPRMQVQNVPITQAGQPPALLPPA